MDNDTEQEIEALVRAELSKQPGGSPGQVTNRVMSLLIEDARQAIKRSSHHHVTDRLIGASKIDTEANWRELRRTITRVAEHHWNILRHDKGE